MWCCVKKESWNRRFRELPLSSTRPKVIGRRKGYYTDNGEDAIVMWSDSIHSPRFRRAYETNLERIDSEVRGLRRELITKDQSSN